MSRLKNVMVDGYNAIYSWQILKALKDESLEDARDRLVFLEIQHT